MSKYTTQVRYICESLNNQSESLGQGSVNEIIANTWNKIFDFDFPIFDENYRSVLCTKILKHYYTREIGLETVGLWKLKLDTKMNEIMPYYNKRYASVAKEFDPFNDADYTREHKGEDSGNNKTAQKSSGSNTAYNLYSDTPQGALVGVENENYLTSATKNTSNGKDERESEGNYATTNEYLEHVVGKFPGRSYAYLVHEWRKTFINVDYEIIEALSDLFMQIW